VISISCL